MGDRLNLITAFFQRDPVDYFLKESFGILHGLSIFANIRTEAVTTIDHVHIKMSQSNHVLDELYMQRALFLAQLGRGSVSPNPMVGSVIVHHNQIIGEGWHKVYGGPHAEVNAIASVKDKSLLPESTLYVNLEPCNHFGKTPPCADLLIQHRLKKVVIANLDTNPLVAGEGIRRMREAGIEVVTGILDKAGRELNKRFFTYMEKSRPYVILKWAETADGFIARENYSSKWISNELSRQLVHKWRSEEDAVMVGARTASHDNPMLNVRDWTGRNPVRIVIDRFLRLDRKLNLFDGAQPTICYNVLKHEEHANLTLARISDENFLPSLLEDLHRKKIQSLFVEGGTFTLNQFIENNLWDEILVFKSGSKFKKGIPAPGFKGTLTGEESIGTDRLSYYHRD
jgi:diaminohydroxyphosphoribosylaminopyrimidine deaminase / 5-amino-6-(5-phosphoribosylamino)uracil reductase